jgi:hypothetical protein
MASSPLCCDFEIWRVGCRGLQHVTERYSQDVANVEHLPEDLSELEPGDLDRAANVRDKRLSPLFRRWPALNRLELSELKRLHNERLRLARYMGRRSHRSRSSYS